MKTLASVLFLTILLSSPGDGLAIDAIVDGYHSQANTLVYHAMFDDARAALSGDGHTLSLLIEQTATWRIVDYDLYVTGTLNDSYSSYEVTQLQNYVAGGGAVLVIHDGGYYSDDHTDSMNSFLAPYGITLAATGDYGSAGVHMTGFEPHCITNGVAELGLDSVRLITSLTAPAVDLTTGDPDFLAYYENAVGGKVIVLTDDSLWSDPGAGGDQNIGDYDNLAILLNIFGCVEASVSAESLSWGDVKAIYD